MLKMSVHMLTDRTERQVVNIEHKLQYKNDEPMPFMIDIDVLNMEVGHIKTSLLGLSLLKHVKEQPNELVMCLVLDELDPNGVPKELEMEENEKMKYYREYFYGCAMFRLRKR